MNTPAASQTPSAASAAGLAPAVRTTYARPLTEGYGFAQAHAEAQREREMRSKQLRLEEEARDNYNHMVQVCLWDVVSHFYDVLGSAY